MSIARKIAAVCFLFLFAVPAVLAQDSCNPAYTQLDYRYYTLDAGLAGDYETAYALFGCWAEAFPEAAKTAYMDRAAIRVMEGDYEGAMADLDLAEADGESGIIPLRRAYVYLAMGDYQLIIDTIPAFRDEFPLRLPEISEVLLLAHRGRGVERVEAGDYEGGIDDLMESFLRIGEDDLTENDAPAVLALATALRMTGELEPAGRAYTSYVALAGDDAEPEIVALVERFAEIGGEAFATDSAEAGNPACGWFNC